MNKRQSKVLHFSGLKTNPSMVTLKLHFEKKGICYYENSDKEKRLFGIEYLERGEKVTFYPTFIAKTNGSIWIYDVIEEKNVSDKEIYEKASALISFINKKKDDGVEVNGGVIRCANNEWLEYLPTTESWHKIEIFKTKLNDNINN